MPVPKDGSVGLSQALEIIEGPLANMKTAHRGTWQPVTLLPFQEVFWESVYGQEEGEPLPLSKRFCMHSTRA